MKFARRFFCLLPILILTACASADSLDSVKKNGRAGFVVGAYFTPSADCENRIVAYIDEAKKIDAAVYSIGNDRIVDAMLRAHRRGADVRVVTDRLQSKGKSSLVKKLQDGGIALRLNKKHKIEHNKFAVFDDALVVTGSYDWTNAATYKNSENCLFFKPADQKYAARFEYLWRLYE